MQRTTLRTAADAERQDKQSGPSEASDFSPPHHSASMSRPKRKPIEKIVVAHDELPGSHPNAWQNVVFIQRFDGETIRDLMAGVLVAASEATGIKDGLGLHEGGAEIRLKSGEVLEAVHFGPKKKELNAGAHRFALQTSRLIAAYDNWGNIALSSGTKLCSSNSEARKW